MSVVDRNTQFRVLEKIQKLSQEWGCEMFNKKLTSISLIFLTLLLGSANTAAQSYTFYHPDANGSPVAATDANGDVLWRENYSPYGEKLIDDMAAIDNSRGFTSHVFDEETGLIYAGARYYDPVVGRFMGVDPAGFDPGNIHSFNQYAYANNNPYRYSDPDGRIPLETVWDIANVGMGVVSLSVNLWNGNYSAAAVDAGGLLLDVGATLIPYVPGGASAAIRAERLGEVGYTVAKGGFPVPKATKALGEWGEARLAQVLGNAGTKPAGAFKTAYGNRFVDRLVNGVAHEAKAGLNVKLTPSIRKQVLKDVDLINSGQVRDVHWHFFQGAESKTLDFLSQHGIKYTVH